MSSLPGLRLEDFLQWNCNIVVIDGDEANMSMALAEVIGTIKDRPRLTEKQFKPVVDIFEPWRGYVEDRLDQFDEENQSWRSYASCAFDSIPDHIYDDGMNCVNRATRATPPKE